MKKLNLMAILAFLSCFANAQTYNEWYGLDDLITSSGTGNTYVEFLMKNGQAKYMQEDGTVTSGLNTVAAGSVIDIADDLWDLTWDPYRKMRINDNSRLDSISFTYLYVRNTHVNMMSGRTFSIVVDTLLVYWYAPNHLKKTKTVNSTLTIPGGKWDMYNLAPTEYFKVDTILLTANDSTSVLDMNGGYENSWSLRAMTLAAPDGLVSDSAAQSKLIGYCLQFRSGVIGADSGYMVYQRPPSTIPEGAKRPNYFGYTILVESSANDWSFMDNSYSGSMFVTNYTAQTMNNGWFGFISGSVFATKKIKNSSFYVSSKIRNDAYKLTASVADESCSAKANGSITVTATGGNAPYQYSINDGPFSASMLFNNLAPGMYKLTVKDASNNTRITYANVWSNVTILAGIIHGEATVTKGADATYTADDQSMETTYKWIVDGGSITGNDATKSLNVKWDATMGTGSVKLVVSNSGCNDTSILYVNRTPSTGITNTLLNSNNIQFYPVPTSEKLMFANVQNEILVEVYNLIGQKELTGHVLPSQPELNVSSLPTGTYMLTIKSATGTQTGRLLID